MGILFKYVTIAFVWGCLFSLTYLIMSSRSEEDVLHLQQILSSAKDLKSYATKQTVLLDGNEQLSLQSISQEDPYLTRVTSKAKLTDFEDFRFEVYFQPDVIYIHDLASELWNKADYTHPVAGQLEGLKDPFALWLRRLKDANKIERYMNDHHEHFIVHLKPFEDEIHGVRLENIDGGTMEIWTEHQPYTSVKLKLDIRFKPNITRGFDQMVYFMEMDEDKRVEIMLPKQAGTAKKIK
ncbi:hypothetical protein M5X11_23335 [Paenibacillus alginolyticus]|uniref:hypothetical protein n=1 Tax=Paenibacillus alginolyticus TaxID=59839 RepID=UPI0003F58E1B|nr:hypothetical protein [Paenibacillus alginolyticus]MCY9667816.1 hypothetical protein [Paenibacillus alginolyticus]